MKHNKIKNKMFNQKEKDLVIGLGEIGNPILKLLSKTELVAGYDLNKKLMNVKQYNELEHFPIRFIHICIPYSEKFTQNVISLSKKFNPKGVVIHSTISPLTTKKIQKFLSIPVIYSATRGIHKRMLNDIKKYTKFYAIEQTSPKSKWASLEFTKLMKKCGIRTKQMKDPITLELAKIVVDTSYYGWLINFAQISNLIATKYGVDYDEMWLFSDEIHKFLGNRPKMFPGFIGGHCVIPNLNLVKEDSLFQIDKINKIYAKKVKNSKSIRKKYDKSQKTSYDV